VDGAFFGTDQEFSVVVLRAEVEAGGCSLPRNGRVLVFRTLVARDLLVV